MYPKRRQYKHVKSQHRLRSWSEYEAGLQRRGDVTVWLSDEALDAWRAPASGKPGGQRTYTDIAIEAAAEGKFGLRSQALRLREGRSSTHATSRQETMTRLGMPDSYRVA
jgi:hypothetical protein